MVDNHALSGIDLKRIGSQAREDPRSSVREYTQFLQGRFTSINNQHVEAQGFAVEGLSLKGRFAHFAYINTLSGASTLRRTARHIGSTRSGCYLIYMPISGRIRLTQFGSAVDCGPGDCAIVDLDEPFLQEKSGHNSTLLVSLEYDRLDAHISRRAQNACACLVDTRAGPASVAFALVASTIREAELIPAAAFNSLSRSVATLVASAVSDMLACDMSDVGRDHALRAQALAFMTAHLGDENLSPGEIARACGVSVRTLQRAYQDHDRTIAGALRNLRLDRARLLLSNAFEDGLSITEIAFRCGFASSAQFSTSFKARFGLSPRDVIA